MKLVLAALALAGCDGCALQGTSVSGVDLAFAPPANDFAVGDDLAPPPNMCGNSDPGCNRSTFGPSFGGTFPLMTDMPPDPNEQDNGVTRDGMGNIVLSI